MLNKLRWLYARLLNNYYYSKKKDINEAKESSFEIVRNLIGLVSFMTFIVLFISVCSVFNISLPNFGKHRLQVYLIFGIILVSYMYYAKKRIKPLFSDIEVVDKDLYVKDHYHIYLVIFGGLFAGAMFGIAILIAKNFRS